MTTLSVTVAMPPSMLDDLKRLARARRTSVSGLVRDLVARELALDP